MRDVPDFVIERGSVGDPVFTADEVAVWPNGLLDQLVMDGVVKPTSNATTVACDACGQDHVESVQYIESPPGTGLRAYIPCPDNGRVRIPLERLRQWKVNRAKLPAIDSRETPGGATPIGKKGTGRKAGVIKRSWTQPDLDNAIREYKAKRAGTYDDLVGGVRRQKPGAVKDARRLFGRNAIADALGVRSRAMVTKSPEWQVIARELQLTKATETQRPRRKVGLDAAIEEYAMASSVSTVDAVVRSETVRLLGASMPPQEAEATIEKLQRGEITDDDARKIAEVMTEPMGESGNRKVRSRL